LSPVRDLLLCAKHLFVAAIGWLDLASRRLDRCRSVREFPTTPLKGGRIVKPPWCLRCKGRALRAAALVA
jgi:hypothetical protein